MPRRCRMDVACKSCVYVNPADTRQFFQFAEMTICGVRTLPTVGKADAHQFFSANNTCHGLTFITLFGPLLGTPTIAMFVLGQNRILNSICALAWVLASSIVMSKQGAMPTVVARNSIQGTYHNCLRRSLTRQLDCTTYSWSFSTTLGELKCSLVLKLTSQRTLQSAAVHPSKPAQDSVSGGPIGPSHGAQSGAVQEALCVLQ